MSDDSVKHRIAAGSTASSLDDCWDSRQRCLSEAGLSKHSDSSVILTEDTDSFIIGERVWVSGKKSGHIAYIGETQFAPGEWAGIALDEPIGKNDGSVGGIRYFQCEPKKGVFCRLTRLTRQPLTQEDLYSRESHIPSPASPVSSGRRGSPSPANSTSLSRMSASMRDSNTSLASNASHHIDYKVGDRVIIKSSQGSKVGTVRFIGTTEFASGEWVGVELDDPRGKNDGSVNGVRYFECRPNFGLFAPIAKVCKSPLKSRPGNCQIHSSSGIPPPSGILRRAGSRESMSNASVTSSSGVSQQGRRVRLGIAALTPHHDSAKDLLKEKQQHIEQLLKERELERSEIAKCAGQVEDAEKKFVTVKLEFDKYRAETETKLKECMDIMNELKQNKSDLQNQLEDEKRKNEDLLFRLEEISITKDETDVLNLSKINELEEKLERAKEGVNLPEGEISKKSEIEEVSLKANEELNALKKQLDDLNKTVLEKDHATKILTESLQREIDKYKSDLLESNNTIEALRQELSKTTAELSRQRDDIETKMSTEKAQAEAALEKQIEQLKIELSAKTYDLETAGNTVQMKDSEIVQLKSEIDDLSGIKNQLEQAMAALKNKEDCLVVLQNELKSSKEKSDKTLNELKAHQETSSSNVSKLEAENAELLSNLKIQSSEFDKTQKELSEKLADTEARLTKSVEDNVSKERELEKVRSDLVNTAEEKDKALKEVKEQYELQLENITTKLKQLQAESDEKNLTLNEMQELKNNASKEITEKSEMKEQLSSTVSRLEEENKQMLNEKADFVKNITEFSDKMNELNTQHENLKQQLHMLKEKLELAVQDGDQSKDALKEKTKEVDDLKVELQSVKETLEAANKDLAEYQANFSDAEVTLRKEKEEFRASLQSERAEFERCRKDFQQKLEEAEKMISEKTVEATDKNQQLEDLEKKLREIQEINEKRLNEVEGRYQKDMEESQTKVSNLIAELESKNIKITDIEREKEEFRTSLNSEKIELEKSKNNLQQKLEEAEKMILEKTVEVTDKNQKLEDLEKQMKEIEERNEKRLNEVKEKYQKDIVESQTKVSNLLVQLESVNIKIADIEKEKEELRASLNNEKVEFENCKKEFQQKLEESEKMILEKTMEVTERP
ncbi:unnamed protein product [Callosobruchus maculatus]|uniref:CAP-Gly domain-containing protein n=1 Tax=Callosobruchus maculatus TaxID=64391 RepID=A0A653D8U9_CALMS|nr:unnamed protein product [Callosobruchus maculatus]